MALTDVTTCGSGLTEVGGDIPQITSRGGCMESRGRVEARMLYPGVRGLRMSALRLDCSIATTPPL